MGLDLAELLMDVEDTFGISFPENMAPMPTVGEFSACIQKLIEEKNDQRCYSGFCFYKLRNTLATVRKLPRKSLRPSTPLREVLKNYDETVIYKEVRGELGDFKKCLPVKTISFNTNSHPLSSMCIVLALISIGLAFCGIIVWWIMGLAAIFFLLIAENIEYHLNDENGLFSKKFIFPKHCSTLGDVARFMSSKLTPEEMGGAAPLQTEVTRRLKEITAQYSLIPPEKIKDSDRFVQDLGLG